jgi:hypothetical protein
MPLHSNEHKTIKNWAVVNVRKTRDGTVKCKTHAAGFKASTAFLDSCHSLVLYGAAFKVQFSMLVSLPRAGKR